MKQVAFAIAPANAVSAVKHCASLVTDQSGGLGAVREATEAIIKHNASIIHQVSDETSL